MPLTRSCSRSGAWQQLFALPGALRLLYLYPRLSRLAGLMTAWMLLCTAWFVANECFCGRVSVLGDLPSRQKSWDWSVERRFHRLNVSEARFWGTADASQRQSWLSVRSYAVYSRSTRLEESPVSSWPVSPQVVIITLSWLAPDRRPAGLGLKGLGLASWL